MILLASFIFREIGASVQFCGKGTDMVLLRPRETAISINPFGVELIQRDIPEFSKTMNSFWDSTNIAPELAYLNWKG